MQINFKIYVRNSIIFTVIVALLIYALTFVLPEKYISPALFYLILFFFSVNLVVHYLLQKAEERKFRRFVSNYMLATFIRFFLYLIVILAYVFINRGDAVPFVISFFILYLIYAVHEVITILPKSGNKTVD